MISSLILSWLLVTKASATTVSLKIAKAWVLKESLAKPESIYFDPETNALYIANVAGDPAKKDKKGWISKVSLDGHILSAQWLKGIDAPKGLRSFQGKLWATNIDEVISVDLKSGALVDRIAVAGSQFLNDIAIDAAGTLYVSDTQGSRIFVLSPQPPTKDRKTQTSSWKVSVWKEGPDLEGPNGLLIDGSDLIVAAWGLPRKDWSTETPGHLYALSLKTKQKRLITKEPLGNLDGLEKDALGHYWVSDWMKGKVYRVQAASGESLMVLEGLKNAADIGWIPSIGRLLVPLMGEDEIRAYRVR